MLGICFHKENRWIEFSSNSECLLFFTHQIKTKNNGESRIPFKEGKARTTLDTTRMKQGSQERRTFSRFKTSLSAKPFKWR